MNICHIYNDYTSSVHTEKILDSFNSVSIDINQLDSLERFDVYIIEINNATKELSKKLKKLFTAKTDSLIYFLIPKEYNLVLFQTAFLLKADSIITPQQNTDKVISKIIDDFKKYQDESLESRLGNMLIDTQHFMYFIGEKLFYISKELFDELGFENLYVVEDRVCSKLDLKELFTDDTVLIDTILDVDNEKIKCFIKSVSTQTPGEKFLIFEPYVKEKSFEDTSFLSSRISFIEFLKDKFLEKTISGKYFSIITIQTQTFKRPDKAITKLESENLLKEFLIQSVTVLDDSILLAQYNKDFFIALFEDVDFTSLKDIAQNYHTQMSNYMMQNEFQTHLSIFAFDINGFEINEILETLEKISAKTISKDKYSDTLQYISNFRENMSEEEMIEFSLERAFINNSEFKLLNIYKGVCVNTASKIIKKSDNTIHIKFEQLQGFVMKNEKITVLQSNDFPKDIRAHIKHIDLNKKIAILENFEFLDTYANSRKYSRVTCSSRTPIVLSYLGGTIGGDIIDISISSVAIQTKSSKYIQTIDSKEVSLSFSLPSQANIDGYIKLNVAARVLFTKCEKDGTCKIICDIVEDLENEAILMQYVYDRQKEIIVEVKKMVKSS